MIDYLMDHGHMARLKPPPVNLLSGKITLM